MIALNPGFTLHPRTTLVEHDLPALVKITREDVKVAINSALSRPITLDARIIGHYITKEHQLKTNTLEFISLLEAHTAAKLEEQVDDVASQYLPDG